MINATNNPYPESPDPSPSKLDKGGYEGNAETLDAKIDAILAEAKVLIDNTLVGSSSVGSIVPSSVPPATGAVHAFATQAGTYTNWGGFVVPANTFAFISRSADLVFSISQTTLDVTGKVNVSDVINTLTSAETAKPLSAAQGKALNENKADLQVGKNIFDKSTAVIGFFLNPSNVQVADSTYDYSDFIPVIAGQQYVSSYSMRFTTYFNSSKVLVSGGNVNDSTTFTVPSGVAFVKVTIFHGKINSFQLEKGNAPTIYENYGIKIPITQLPELSPYYRKSTLLEALRLNETDWAILGKNLYNPATRSAGYFVSWVDGTLSASASYQTSDFIEVLPSTNYVSTGGTMRSYAIYTAEKIFISGAQYASSFAIPSNGKYIKISSNNSNYTSLQFEVGTLATGYESYGYTTSLLKTTAVLENSWKNIETNCLGDSITAQNIWQPYLMTKLNLLLTSFGIGGTTIAGTSSNSFNNDVRVNALSSTAKLIIVMGGTNDWAQNYPLGLENSTALTDFNGGLNVLIEKLLNKYHTAGILTQFLFIGTPYGELYNFSSRGWANAYTNTQGLTTRDYAEAVRKRCIFYGIPYVDSSNFGWNKINIREYITDDGGLLHPNTAGGKRIASVVIGKLKSLEPVL